MNIEKALEHLTRKIGRSRYSTTYDKECINEVIAYVNKTREGMLERQAVFFKLYIWAYRQLLAYYEASVFDDIPQKELHKLLDKPVEMHVHEFTNYLNDQEIYSAFDITGCPDFLHVHIDHLRHLLTQKGYSEEKISKRIEKLEKDREQWHGRFQEYLEKHPELEKALWQGQKVWDEKDVGDQLKTMMAKAIENFN